MADSSKPKSGSGCLIRLLVMILLVGASVLGVALLCLIQPQDLADIGGSTAPGQAVAGRDMKAVLQSSIDRGYPVTLTETEINQWLARTVVAKQGGLLAQWVTLERVCVRLKDGCAEVVMARKIMGQPFTVSMFLKIEQTQGPKGVQTAVLLHGGSYLESLPQPQRGGRFGNLVVPQGFLLLVLPAYQHLVALFSEEIHLGFEEMARINIEKGRLVLDPREPAANLLGDPLALPRTF